MASVRVLPLVLVVALAGCAAERQPLTASPGAPARLAAVNWAEAETVNVSLTDYRITPKQLVLAIGRPYRLHIENRGGTAHNFDAPEFLGSAALRDDAAAKAALAAGGKVDVAMGEAADLYLVPSQAGTFPVECSRPMHASLGMRGDIVVR